MFQLLLKLGFNINDRVFGCFVVSFERIAQTVELNTDINEVFWGEVNESLLGHSAARYEDRKFRV